MRRILSCILCILLCLMFAEAFSEGEKPLSLSNSIIVRGCTEDQSHILPQVMICAHEHGRLMDGALAFVPLDAFIMRAQMDIPVFQLASAFSWHITADGYPEDVSCRPQLLQYTPAGFVRVETDIQPAETPPCAALSVAALPEGVYLLRLDLNATSGDEYYACAAFAWLVIGECDPADYGIPILQSAPDMQATSVPLPPTP